MDGRSRLSRAGGKVHHISVVASHAEYCVVPEAGAIAVPREIPFDRACLLGCGVMTGVGAVVRKAKIEPGASVLGIGSGAFGLNALQGARIAGAALIVVVDRDASKRNAATTFGATMALDGRQVHSCRNELTRGTHDTSRSHIRYRASALERLAHQPDRTAGRCRRNRARRGHCRVQDAAGAQDVDLVFGVQVLSISENRYATCTKSHKDFLR